MKPSTTFLSIWKKTNLITNQLTEVYSLATGLQKSTPLFSLWQTAHDKHGGRDEGVVETEGLDSNGSRSARTERLDGNRSRAAQVKNESGNRYRIGSQVETEGSIGLAREESNNVEQWRGKRRRSEDSDESSTNQWQHRQKKGGRRAERIGRSEALLHRRTVIPTKEGPQGTTNGVRGESPPLFIQGPEQGRGPGEKRPTKDLSCPQSLSTKWSRSRQQKTSPVQKVQSRFDTRS
ncbi:hypothetical protein TNIN_81891 [Trichonephila inaurata madagascariensis]|uniref:Uncharacterized protein n=1 Tax=Trichonephila inaurata madagascariensis TaxID=2747483 RepID=A0A8X6YFR5_9ARAC|nr:hypothetical protein TNIN_81891 [Trichonephila inaurata madagascariensis]